MEVRGVIVDRLLEDIVVGDGDDTAGVLPRSHPHGRRIPLLRRRLAHFQDAGLHEIEGDDIAAHSAHDNTISHAEILAAKDYEIASERRNHAL